MKFRYLSVFVILILLTGCGSPSHKSSVSTSSSTTVANPSSTTTGSSTTAVEDRAVSEMPSLSVKEEIAQMWASQVSLPFIYVSLPNSKFQEALDTDSNTYWVMATIGIDENNLPTQYQAIGQDGTDTGIFKNTGNGQTGWQFIQLVGEPNCLENALPVAVFKDFGLMPVAEACTNLPGPAENVSISTGLGSALTTSLTQDGIVTQSMISGIAPNSIYEALFPQWNVSFAMATFLATSGTSQNIFPNGQLQVLYINSANQGWVPVQGGGTINDCTVVIPSALQSAWSLSYTTLKCPSGTNTYGY